jgi:hypothetical protein
VPRRGGHALHGDRLVGRPMGRLAGRELLVGEVGITTLSPTSCDAHLDA